MRETLRSTAVLALPLVASGLLLSGCMSSPTYGTSKTANAQLTTDLSNMFSFKPAGGTSNDYKPRPELVKPASLTELPAPQDNIATASNPDWPESPEQRRARIRADATANQDNTLYDPLVVEDSGVAKPARRGMILAPSDQQDEEQRPLSNTESRAKSVAYAQKKAASNQGSPTKRQFLSEPPLEYRMPAATAATDELGEDEQAKERRIKAEASGKTGSKWRDMVPWL